MTMLLEGLYILRKTFFAGTCFYGVILIFLFASHRRSRLSLSCIPEWMLSVYLVSVLFVTGLYPFSFSLGGTMQYELIPFRNSAIRFVLLNFLMFVPCGILLPAVFPSFGRSWRRTVLLAGLISLAIETAQLFAGRLAEIDDLIVNILGGGFGYLLFFNFKRFGENKGKAVGSVLVSGVLLTLFFAGVYAVGKNEPPVPDGLEAVEGNVKAVSVVSEGKRKEADGEIYDLLAVQLSNCGGHELKTEYVPQDIPMKENPFIEILYDAPQTVRFENAPDFIIRDADRLLYDAEKNILYWGNGEYCFSVDYLRLDADMEPHREDVRRGYAELAETVKRQVSGKEL